MEIEWGPEIAVDGKRPEWLQGTIYGYQIRGGKIWHLSPPMSKWYAITKIRLPASHPAYIAIDKGFTPWSGGDEAPGDWDGSETIARNGNLAVFSSWSHPWSGPNGTGQKDYDIIGYRRKSEAISPQPIGSATIAELSIKVDTTELKAAIAATASYTVTRDGLTITGPDLAHILRSIREDGE